MGLQLHTGATMTARPPKITKCNSLALFVWLEKVRHFFIRMRGPNVRNVYVHSLPLLGGCDSRLHLKNAILNTD